MRLQREALTFYQTENREEAATVASRTRVPVLARPHDHRWYVPADADHAKRMLGNGFRRARRDN
jgi:hypothetical protein